MLFPFSLDGFLPQHYGAALKIHVKYNTHSLEWAFPSTLMETALPSPTLEILTLISMSS